jgi:hypothetical protein
MVVPAVMQTHFCLMLYGAFSGDMEGRTTNHWCEGSSIKKSHRNFGCAFHDRIKPFQVSSLSRH